MATNGHPDLFLSESEQLNQLINSVPQLLWVANSNAEVVYYNERLEDYTPAAHVDGKLRWENLLHPDDLAATKEAWDLATKAKKLYRHEHRLCMKNGEYRWHISRAYPKNFQQELMWYGSATDHHEEKLALERMNENKKHLSEISQELRYQKKLLETVTQNTSLALFLMDDKQQCIYMNESAEIMTGFTLEELKGKELHYYIHHKHPDGTHYPLEDCPIDRALPQKNREQGEEVFIHKDGHFYPVAFTASPIVVGGTPIGTVIEVRDTTNEKKKEFALKESEELFRTLIESLPHLVWMKDTVTKKGFLSSQWSEYTGEAGIADDRFLDMFHPDDRELLVQTWKKSKDIGTPFKIEARIRNRKGEYRWFNGHGEPVRDLGGTIIKWIGAYTDIHEQKTGTELLESLVDERTGELRQSQEVLQARNEQLSMANQELESLNYVASHDLQEPLRKIRTFISIMRSKDVESDVVKGLINKINDSAERMSSLIHDILEYRRISHSEERQSEVDLNEVLHKVLMDFELLTDEKHAVIRNDALPVVMAVGFQMNQLFINLVGNALKYTEHRPELTISSTLKKGYQLEKEFPGQIPDKDYAEISFKDNGIGFDHMYEEKIFSLFKRLHNKHEFSGTGIGLSICRKIAENHGGHIFAKGEPGNGSTFTVYLPVPGAYVRS